MGIEMQRHDEPDETDGDKVWQTVLKGAEGKGRSLAAFAVVFVFVSSLASVTDKVTEYLLDAP